MIKIQYLETDTFGNKINKIKRIDLPSELQEWKEAINRINKKLKYKRYHIIKIESNYIIHTS